MDHHSRSVGICVSTLAVGASSIPAPQMSVLNPARSSTPCLLDKPDDKPDSRISARSAGEMGRPTHALRASAVGDLFLACRRGDPNSFTELYRRFAPIVHGIVLAAIGPADAEDVTQEVFVKVHRWLHTVSDQDAFAGWICKVARNAATDRHRQGRRQPTAMHLVEEPRDPREDSDPELPERVLALIQDLPPSYRETLVLRLVEGLSGPEIAAQTGMTHGSVRVNLTRGMAMLRTRLNKEGWS